MSNSYLVAIEHTLPRLLSLFDMDRTRESFGYGDRYHWAWGLIDFSNGSFQGAAHGLARLLVNNLLPKGVCERSILFRIDAMFVGMSNMRRADGSLEEAFPNEGSFCVTALAAFDLLTAIELLSERLTEEQRQHYFSAVRPLVGFLHRSDETHAFISNHLATAAAALFKWQLLTGEAGDERGQVLLDSILAHQSAEGWFVEYEGADPGYQSLCLYYLTDLHRIRPDLNLISPLIKAVDFLSHFIHPDGSFGGVYGSRNTRFFIPAAFEYLASEIPMASIIAKSMRKSIMEMRVVGLEMMDEANLIPIFNAYCWAASVPNSRNEIGLLPCFSRTPFRIFWEHAGLLVDRGTDHYTVVSTHKGGVVYHYKNDRLFRADPGCLVINKAGTLYSSQNFCMSNTVRVSDEKLEINSDLMPVNRRLSKPYQFILLRSLNVTVMRFRLIREKVKQLLVKLLITRKGKSIGRVTRTIELGYELVITDVIEGEGLVTTKDNSQHFVAIHMASQGYWQIQDDSTE